MPPVTPEDVAERYPEAVAVSADDVQEAVDWAERDLSGPIPDPATAKGRALVRAIMAYAVALALGLDVQVIRTATGVAATKKIKVGPIEIEKATSSGDIQVAGFLASTEYWLGRATQALAEAGVPVTSRAFAGVSR